MKLKTMFPVIMCILVGFFMSNFMFKQYNSDETILVSGEKEGLYFLQVGVYSSEESMKDNLKNTETYIYEKADNLYYAYVGIIKSEENLNKLKGYFEDLDYVIYSKVKNVENKAFLEVLNQYEIMLKETSDSKTIKTIANQIISKYEELVLNGQN